MEVGGVMCHAAVVARELGIPAVFGVTRATEILARGQRVLGRRLPATRGALSCSPIEPARSLLAGGGTALYASGTGVPTAAVGADRSGRWTSVTLLAVAAARPPERGGPTPRPRRSRGSGHRRS